MKLPQIIPVVLGLVIAIGAQAANAPVPAPKLPTHPWGVYAWGGARNMTVPPDMPIRGIPISWRWPELEPARGKFNFEEAVRRPLEAARARGHFTHIMLWVAPVTPEWVYEAGVPKVIVPERITPARKLHKPTYPYYFSPLYKEILRRTVRALADAVWDHRLSGGGDLALRHAGGSDTTFHLIELERQR